MDNVPESRGNLLQQDLDALTPGATLELLPPRWEFPGPLTIRQAVTLEGKGATLWALKGPVVTVQGTGVVLRNLNIEVTGDTVADGTAEECAILLLPGAGLLLENVEVRGTVKGWPEEEGEWQLPGILYLGRLTYGSTHELRVRVGVPAPCRIHSEIAGLKIEPPSLKPGIHDLRLQIEALPKDTLLDGSLILTTAFLKRRIAVNAYIAPEWDQTGPALVGKGQIVWEPPQREEPPTPQSVPQPPLRSDTPPTPIPSPKATTSEKPWPQEVRTPAGTYTPSTLAQNQTPGQFFKQPSAQSTPASQPETADKQNLPGSVILPDLFGAQAGKKAALQPSRSEENSQQRPFTSAENRNKPVVPDLFGAEGHNKQTTGKAPVPQTPPVQSPLLPGSPRSVPKQSTALGSAFTTNKAQLNSGEPMESTSGTNLGKPSESTNSDQQQHQPHQRQGQRKKSLLPTGSNAFFNPENHWARRLPIYVLLDVSVSMQGQPIEAVRQGLQFLKSDLKNDPQALEIVWISVITFGEEARQVCPLTELIVFQEPYLQASIKPGVALGDALRLLEQSLHKEVRQSTKETKGDWLPIVFLMISDSPTDEWKTVADRINANKLVNIIVSTAGPNLNESLMIRITDKIIRLDTVQPENLKASFRWISQRLHERFKDS